MTEESKKLGAGVYCCELCKGYFSENYNSKYKIMKWFVCGNCYYSAGIDAKKEKIAKRVKKRKKKQKNKSFTIQLNQAKDFKSIIGATWPLIEDTKIEITKEGFIIFDTDFSKICILKVNLSSSFFVDYDSLFEKQHIKLNVEDLYKILEKIPDDATICLTNTFDSNAYLTIKSGDETFDLALLDDVSYDPPHFDKLLKIEYPYSFSFKLEEFDRILENALLYSEIIYFQKKKSVLIISAEGQKGRYRKQIKIEKESDAPLKAAYSINFLRNFINPLKESVDTMKIALKTDYPSRIDIKFDSQSSLLFFQAPRVDGPEDDDEDEFF